VNFMRRLWQTKALEPRDFREGHEDRYKPILTGQSSYLDFESTRELTGQIVGGPIGGVRKI